MFSSIDTQTCPQAAPRGYTYTSLVYHTCGKIHSGARWRRSMSRLGYFLKEVRDLLSGKALRDFKAQLAQEGIEHDAHEAAQRCARRNITLIAGYFITPAQLDKERKEHNAIRFP